MQKSKIKVLIEGYVKKDGTGVAPTVTLIRDGNISIIVDPGMGKNIPERLKQALKKEGLSLEEVNIVFTTHYHLDHTQYVGIFPKAKLIDSLYTYEADKWSDHKGDGYKISPNVSILHTPGHSIEHASLVVNTNGGLMVVAGDVWWFSDMTPKKDDMAWNQKVLEKSRKKVLEIADWIIPGHGKMFKSSKK